MTQFIPQRKFDFLFDCDDENLNLVVTLIRRPPIYRGVKESRLQVVFREMIDVDVIGALTRWLDAGPRTVKISLLDHEGDVIEEIKSDDAKIIDIYPGELSLEENDVTTIMVSIFGLWTRTRK